MSGIGTQKGATLLLLSTNRLVETGGTLTVTVEVAECWTEAGTFHNSSKKRVGVGGLVGVWEQDFLVPITHKIQMQLCLQYKAK